MPIIIFSVIIAILTVVYFLCKFLHKRNVEHLFGTVFLEIKPDCPTTQIIYDLSKYDTHKVIGITLYSPTSTLEIMQKISNKLNIPITEENYDLFIDILNDCKYSIFTNQKLKKFKSGEIQWELLS